MVAEPIAPVPPPFVSTAKRDVADLVGIMSIIALLSVAFIPSILSLCLL